MMKRYTLLAICLMMGVGASLVFGENDAADRVRVEIVDLKAEKPRAKDVKNQEIKVDDSSAKPVKKPAEVVPAPQAKPQADKEIPEGNTNEMLAKLVKEGLDREKVLLLENKQLKDDLKQVKSELQNAIKIIRVQQESIENLKKELAKNREVSLNGRAVELIDVE